MKRLTGTVKIKATDKLTASLHQNKTLDKWALIAPGISHSRELSITTIEIIEIVSMARASLTASGVDIPRRRAP